MVGKGLVDRWCGDDPDLPISVWTLRFRNHGVECGYLNSKRAKLASSTAKVGGLSALAIASSILFHVTMEGGFDPSTAPSRAAFEVRMRSQACEFVVVLLGFSLAALMSIHHRIPQLTPLRCEVTAVLFTICCLIFGALTEDWYMARLSGIEDPLSEMLRPFTDTYVLLLLDMVITLVHISLPVRWCMIWPVEIVGVAAYPCLVALFGSPEPGFVQNHALCIALLVAFSAVGKRSMERHERRAYYDVIKERTKRAESEFKLQQMVEQSGLESALPSDVQTCSLPSTSPTERQFANLDPQHLDETLRALASTGEREHWLVRTQDLQLAPTIRLGEGAFGTVYKGHLGDTPVAVKVSSAAATCGQLQQLPQLVNELRIMRHIRHPNIATFYGAVIDPQHLDLALVLELVDGQAMDQYISQSQRPPHRIRDIDIYCIVLGSCRALEYLHRYGMVHGDVKPSNVMIETEHRNHPAAKLLDFGLSRVLTKKAKPLGGTLRWAAPELLGTPDGVAPRPRSSADVYSFGRLLHYAVTGIQAFDGKSERTVRAALLQQRLPVMAWAEFSPLTPLCRRVAEDCVKIQPERRPLMSIVLHDLQTWLDGACSNALAAEAEQALRKGMKPWSDGLQQIRNRTGCKEYGGDDNKKPSDAVTSTPAVPTGDRKRPSGAVTSTPAVPTGDRKRPSGAVTSTSAVPTGDSKKTSGAVTSTPAVPTCVLAPQAPGNDPTPKASQYLTLLHAMSRWVLEHSETGCCDMHTRAEHMVTLLEELRGAACGQLPHCSGPACPKCGLLCDDTDSTQDGVHGQSLECAICGHNFMVLHAHAYDSVGTERASEARGVARTLQL